MKYIDAERLKAEIERLQKFNNSMSINAVNSNMRNFYDGEEDCCKQLLSFIDSLQQGKPSLPNDLDEASEKWCEENNKGIALCADKKSHYLADGMDAFKAGAEWQYQKDRGEFAKIKAKTWSEGFDACKEQMLKDGNVILAEEDFDAEKEKSMEWGYNLCKVQMMKEAVEGEIQMRYSGCLCAKTIRAINEDKFKFGDKVRIIIVKEEKG